MFVPDVKESTKKQVQVNTSAEISEMVTFNKTGQAIQWVHAIDYEKLEAENKALKTKVSSYEMHYAMKIDSLRTLVLKKPPRHADYGLAYGLDEIENWWSELKQVMMREPLGEVNALYARMDDANNKLRGENAELLQRFNQLLENANAWSEQRDILKEKIKQFHWWLYNKDAPNPCGAKAEAEIRAKFKEFFPVM
jgi:hypothetical protein